MTQFPVTESTLSAKHLALFIAGRYGFENATCKLLRTGMNHLYLVATGTEQYVFRVYTVNWRTTLDIAEELRLLDHLKSNGISVSYPIADVNGSYVQELEAPEGLRYGVLFSFAPGKKDPRFSAEVSRLIGITMARLHNITEGFQLQRVTYNEEILLDRSFEMTSDFFGTGSTEMEFVKGVTELLRSEYCNADVTQLPDGAVHLDIWFDNLHLDGNDITLFDFDFCGNGRLVHDVAYFIYQLCFTNPVEADYIAKRDAFLEGYTSVRQLTAEEIRMIPYTALGVIVFFLGIQCNRFDTWSNIFLNEDHLKRFIMTMKKWMTVNGLDPDQLLVS